MDDPTSNELYERGRPATLEIDRWAADLSLVAESDDLAFQRLIDLYEWCVVGQRAIGNMIEIVYMRQREKRERGEP